MRRAEELAVELSSAWLHGTRGERREAVNPQDEGRRVGTLCREVLRVADRLPEDDREPGVRAGLQVFSEFVNNGGLPEVTLADAAKWLVEGAAAAIERARAASARHPLIDPWGSGTIRLVTDFLRMHSIRDLPVSARDGAAVGSWVGVLFAEVLRAVAASHAAGFDEALYVLALECASAEPRPGGYVGLSSFEPQAVATWITSMYQSAVEAFRSS